MKKSRTLLVMICLIGTVSLYGQNEFKPGYIIGLDQDTIFGQIESRSESRNAKSCVFRAGDQADPVRYMPGEIAAYRFTDGKYYVSSSVEVDGVKNKVFMEFLVNGIADLYYLREDNSETYYIQKEGEEALALDDIRLLKAAFSDCYEIQSSLDRATLSHKSLISMTEKYHAYVNEGEACIIYSKEASGLWLRVGPVVGYSMNSLSFSGDPIFESFDFGKSTVPVFGILVDLGSGRLGDHLSFQLGAGFSKQGYHSYGEKPDYTFALTAYSYDAHLESSVIAFQLGAKYSFSGKRIRPSLGGGMEITKFAGTDFHYVENGYLRDSLISSTTWIENPIENLFFGAYVQAGVDVKLSEKLVLVSALKAGYSISNPNTIAGGLNYEQIRIRPEFIPVSAYIGIQFRGR